MVTSGDLGLIDTNTIILLERLDPSFLPETPRISSITLAELSVGPLVATDPTEQAIRQLRLQVVESSFDPIPFDANAARAFGAIASELRHAGRTTSARAFDALIAATALANNLPLYTCNPSDFSSISRLEVRAVPHPDA